MSLVHNRRGLECSCGGCGVVRELYVEARDSGPWWSIRCHECEKTTGHKRWIEEAVHEWRTLNLKKCASNPELDPFKTLETRVTTLEVQVERMNRSSLELASELQNVRKTVLELSETIVQLRNDVGLLLISR